MQFTKIEHVSESSVVAACVDQIRAAEASFGHGMYSLAEPCTALAWLLNCFALLLSPAQLLVASRVETCKDDVEGRTGGSVRAAAAAGSRCCAWKSTDSCAETVCGIVAMAVLLSGPILALTRTSQPVVSICCVERLLSSFVFPAQEEEAFSFPIL